MKGHDGGQVSEDEVETGIGPVLAFALIRVRCVSIVFLSLVFFSVAFPGRCARALQNPAECRQGWGWGLVAGQSARDSRKTFPACFHARERLNLAIMASWALQVASTLRDFRSFSNFSRQAAK